MKRYLRLYAKFMAQFWKSLMEYKTDFIVGLFAFFVIQATGIIFIYLIFQQIPKLNGWNFDQIVFIYGFAQLPRGLDHLLTDNLWMLSGRIIARGQFDRYLLRPINPLFQLIAEVIQPDAIGELAVGIILVTTSIYRLHISLSLIDILIFIFLVICGSIIYTSIKLLFASIAFWIKFSQAILFMNYMMSDFGKYPMSIYSKWLQVILSYIIPFAFTAYYPASYFIGKVNIKMAALGTFSAAIISFAIAYTVWNFGIRAYESSGN